MAKRKGNGALNSRKTFKTPNPAIPIPTPITCRLMSDDEVLGFETPYYPFFGSMCSFEQQIFRAMGELCPEYTGGLWSYHMLSNGGWYMAPEAATFSIADWEGTRHPMSSDVAGLAITQYVVNHLSWYFHEKHDQVAKNAAIAHFDALQAYTATHPDAAAIRWALD